MKKFLKFCAIGLCSIVAVCCLLALYANLSVDKVSPYKIGKYGEDISIVVDFSKSPANPRFFVYDTKSKELLMKSKCAHGGGGGSTMFSPKFSNRPNSHCSSLGDYRLRCTSRSTIYLPNFTTSYPCIRLDGLSSTNSNASSRGILIHGGALGICEPYSAGWLPIPASNMISQGCFTISNKTFEDLSALLDGGKKMYLYAIYPA